MQMLHKQVDQTCSLPSPPPPSLSLPLPLPLALFPSLSPHPVLLDLAPLRLIELDLPSSVSCLPPPPRSPHLLRLKTVLLGKHGSLVESPVRLGVGTAGRDVCATVSRRQRENLRLQTCPASVPWGEGEEGDMHQVIRLSELQDGDENLTREVGR
eukprot:757546-Hanusia_phi.AAC.2